jgi:hypothetical protein
MLGVVKDVSVGKAEMLASSAAIKLARTHFVDYLPVITSPRHRF